jgi:hypothetical protein
MRNCRVCYCLLVILVLTTVLPAEDVKLREQAVQLLELANAVSLPGALKNYKQSVTFRFHELDGSVKDGTFTKVYVSASQYRTESSFGDYRDVMVFTPGNRRSDKGNGNPPVALLDLRAQLPVNLGHFDESDVIRSIESREVLDRPAKCIEFNTHVGESVQSNEICVDIYRGSVIRWQVGDELFENTGYFRVGSLWEPAHIRRYRSGKLNLEIEQSIESISGDIDPQLFSPPSGDWSHFEWCRNPRPAVGIWTPMPAPGTNGKAVVDVVVYAFIWQDGTVDETIIRPQIESSPRPDLNEEAIKTVLTWRFSPLICNDREAGTDLHLVVHFQGR